MMAGKGESATSTGTSPTGADVLRSGADVAGATVPYDPTKMASPAASVDSAHGVDWQQFLKATMQGGGAPSSLPGPVSPLPDVGTAPPVENLRPLSFAPYGARLNLSRAPAFTGTTHADLVTQFLAMLGKAR